MCSRGVTIYAFWLIDVKVSESTVHCGYVTIFTEGSKLLVAGRHAIVFAD